MSPSRARSCGKCFRGVSTLTYKWFCTVCTPIWIFFKKRIPSLFTQSSYDYLEMRCSSFGKMLAWCSCSPGLDHKCCINWMLWSTTDLCSWAPGVQNHPCYVESVRAAWETWNPISKWQDKQATQKTLLFDWTAWACLVTSNPILSFGLCHTFDCSSCLEATFGNSQTLEAK